MPHTNLPRSHEAADAADEIAALLGSARDWTNPDALLEEIADRLARVGYPHPGNLLYLDHYRREADRLGIERIDAGDDDYDDDDDDSEE